MYKLPDDIVDGLFLTSKRAINPDYYLRKPFIVNLHKESRMYNISKGVYALSNMKIYDDIIKWLHEREDESFEYAVLIEKLHRWYAHLEKMHVKTESILHALNKAEVIEDKEVEVWPISKYPDFKILNNTAYIAGICLASGGAMYNPDGYIRVRKEEQRILFEEMKINRKKKW